MKTIFATEKYKDTRFLLCIFAGLCFRFTVSARGYNYDFESYCLVGDIASNFQNVYAETFRYNYGFVFSAVLGICYKLASLSPVDTIFLYRMFIVAILSMADLGIAIWLAYKYSLKAAVFFFLNPISIIITGYHNQFDNIAICLILYSSFFYNEDEGICKRDGLFVLFVSLSLMVKHIFFMLPVFLLLKKGLSWKKRIIYSCVPPAIFLLSFVPFCIGNSKALSGIIDNVFLYRSTNNAPLLGWLYYGLGIPEKYWFYIFVLILIAFALLLRMQNYDYQILFYSLIMVTFSSAIANQYLVIVLAALCALNNNDIYRICYSLYGMVFLSLNGNGLHLIYAINRLLPQEYLVNLTNNIADETMGYSYTIMTFILFALVCSEVYLNVLRRTTSGTKSRG